MTVHITIRLKGFERGSKELKAASRNFKTVVATELRAFSQEAVDKLKSLVLNNELGLPAKRRPNGEPPLVDSRKYIYSYRVVMAGNKATIQPTGMNDNMSNAELADILEFGDGKIPARPHLRPLGLWVEQQLPKLGERIAHVLLRGS